MNLSTISRIPDSELERELVLAERRESFATAEFIAYLAEFDARKLYLPAAYPSMHAYCVEVLRLSESAAFRRIQAARAARDYPQVFEALSDGRLNLTGVLLLAGHLTRENADELLAAAAGKCKGQIEEFLAARFPTSEPLPLVQPLAVSRNPDRQLAPERVDVFPTASRSVEGAPSAVPIAFQRYEHRVCLGQSAQDDFEYAKSLLGHATSGDSEQIYARAFAALVRELERSKLGASLRSRAARSHVSANPRHIPARVKQAVWERDQGRCTFVSDDGHRCSARKQLEFDHIDPVARGGGPNVENIRLRCRAHNQYEAERMFGAGFMCRKREQARAAASVRGNASESPAVREMQPANQPQDDGERVADVARKRAAGEVVPYLRKWDPLESTCRHASLSIL